MNRTWLRVDEQEEKTTQKQAPRGSRVRRLTEEHFPAEIAQAVRREMPSFDIERIHETNLAGLLEHRFIVKSGDR